METIYEILTELRPEFDFKESKNYIEDGYLDSFDIVNLVSELESKYDILIDALDIVSDNFISADAICTLVEKCGGTV